MTAGDDDEPTDPGIPSNVHLRVSPRAYATLLDEDPDAYEELLTRHGGDLILAGYEIASLRMHVAGHGGPPNALDVMAAARVVRSKTQRLLPVPARKAVVAACERHGLPLAGY